MDYNIPRAAVAADTLQGFLSRLLKDIDTRLLSLESSITDMKNTLLAIPKSAGSSSFVGNPDIPAGVAIKMRYDSKGLITKAEDFSMSDVPSLTETLAAKAPLSHGHVPSEITGLSETIDDRVSALLFAGLGVTLNYNDAANQLEIVVSGASVTQNSYMPGGW